MIPSGRIGNLLGEDANAIALGASQQRGGQSRGKKAEIQQLLVQWRAEIASGQVRVMFLGECHLLWGDLCGFGWSRRNQRVDGPIASTQKRQTYYGALDYLSKSFVVHEYEAGNQHNTVAFLEYLQFHYDESTRFLSSGLERATTAPRGFATT